MPIEPRSSTTSQKTMPRKTILAAMLVLSLGGLVPTGPAYAVGVSDALPHVLWKYTFRDNGDQYNPLAERHYLTCTYYGPHGEITVHAEFGRCTWLKRFNSQPENVIQHRR